MKRIILIAAVFLMLPLPIFAEWSDHGLALVTIWPSSQEGAVKYELRDGEGRVFFINAPREPDASSIKRILKYKDGFFSWQNVKITELSFYMYDKGIQAVIIASSATHKNTELKPYLPSGISFIEGKDKEGKDGLRYRYRIIVGNNSLKLDGTFSGEDPLLEEMYAYIMGIREGRIVVEDEKVVSGSVVSLRDERKKGEKQVHPIGDLPVQKLTADKISAKAEDGGKIQFYVSAQGSYLYPVRFMGDIFVGGYGATLSLGMCDVGFSLWNKTLFTLQLEFSSGFWYLSERSQKDKFVNYSVNRAYVIPLGLTGRYCKEIFKDFFISPSVGFGYYFNRLEYNRLSAFGTVERRAVREWNPSLSPGLRFDYRNGKMVFFTGVDLLVMFERRLNIVTLVFHAGCGYMF